MTRIKVGCRNVVLVAIILLVLAAIMRPNSKDNNEAYLPTLAQLPSLTWTPEIRAVAIEATEPPGVTIIPTVVPQQASSGFITITPLLGTIYSTSTVTNTNHPSATANTLYNMSY